MIGLGFLGALGFLGLLGALGRLGQLEQQPSLALDNLFRLFSSKDFIHFRRNDIGRNFLHAAVVAEAARLIAKDGAGTARQLLLHEVCAHLSPAHKARIGVRLPPNRHHGAAHE